MLKALVALSTLNLLPLKLQCNVNKCCFGISVISNCCNLQLVDMWFRGAFTDVCSPEIDKKPVGCIKENYGSVGKEEELVENSRIHECMKACYIEISRRIVLLLGGVNP